jgi:sugar lactone lactonase YvrE
MSVKSGRYTAASGATTADGWTIQRLTGPSRLFSANGLRTGPDGRIYIAQVAGSEVSAIDVDSGEIEVISPRGGAIVGPDDLVFGDDGTLYVTEITENQVRSLRPNGTSEVVQDNVFVANPITFHQGHLIAGELRMGGRIMELNLNGGAPRVIYEGVPMVNAFDVGPDGKLYFPAQAANEIWRISLNGGQPEVVATGLGIPDSVKFHPDGYIVSTQVHSGEVLKIDPRTGDKSVLAHIGPGLDNVAFVNGRTFVSHITGSIHEIVKPGVVKALVDKGLEWPLGLAVGPDSTVFVADGGFNYTIAPGGEPELAGMIFSAGFPGWVRAVAADGAGQWVVTTANGTVARWRPQQQAHEQLASGYDRLMGVALTASGGIVFAEWATGRILLLNGSTTTELARGLDGPMGVAIGKDGGIYVAESGGGRVIRIADGKPKTVIADLHRPEGIAIAGNKLYVIDTVAKNLIEYELTSGSRRSIAMDLPVGAPQGVVVKQLGGVGDMCGPMYTFTGLAVAADGTVFVSGDADGSVLGVRPAAGV